MQTNTGSLQRRGKQAWHREGVEQNQLFAEFEATCLEVSLSRFSPAERLMRTSQITPVEELAKAALLFDAVGRWA
jgi:hypothetical protein